MSDLNQYAPQNGKWVDSQGRLTTAAQIWLRDLWLRAGGQSSLNLNQLEAMLIALQGDVTALEAIVDAIIRGHVIEDEGVALTQRGVLNFTGAGVTVTDSGTKTVVQIDGAPAGAGQTIFLPVEDGDEGPPGPPGQRGVDGAAGATGSQGPMGPAVFLEAEPGDDGLPGMPGRDGAAGATGAQGLPGITVFMAGDDGEQGEPGFPGQRGTDGAAGSNGATGAQGPLGPAVYLEAEIGEDGPIGPPGIPATIPTIIASPYAPGSFSVPTGYYAQMSNHLQLVSTQRATIAGTGQLRID